MHFTDLEHQELYRGIRRSERGEHEELENIVFRFKGPYEGSISNATYIWDTISGKMRWGKLILSLYTFTTIEQNSHTANQYKRLMLEQPLEVLNKTNHFPIY